MESEPREPLEFTAYHWTHAQRAERFLEGVGRGALTKQEQEDSAVAMDEFIETSDGRPMARTAVLIPVSTQDKDRIYPTLREYAGQKGAHPFTIFLSINGAYHDDDAMFAAEAEVDRAQKDFPELDVRTMMLGYEQPRIGMIRRDLWNAAVMLAHNEGLFDHENGDVIGINNDIDAEKISPHYIARIQAHYNEKLAYNSEMPGLSGAMLHPASTRLTHAVSSTHPHVGMVTRWSDNTHFQGRNSFEAGLVVPFMHYVLRGGFDAQDVTHETHPLTADLPYGVPYLMGAQLYTSPRRYIDRLSQGFDETEIWSNDSFTHEDDCRTELKPDITEKHAHDLIAEHLESDLMHYWLRRPVDDYLMRQSKAKWDRALNDASAKLSHADEHRIRQETADIVLGTTEKAARLMEKLVGSEVLAAAIREVFDTPTIIENVANRAIRIANPSRTKPL